MPETRFHDDEEAGAERNMRQKLAPSPLQIFVPHEICRRAGGAWYKRIRSSDDAERAVEALLVAAPAPEASLDTTVSVQEGEHCRALAGEGITDLACC